MGVGGREQEKSVSCFVKPCQTRLRAFKSKTYFPHSTSYIPFFSYKPPTTYHRLCRYHVLRTTHHVLRTDWRGPRCASSRDFVAADNSSRSHGPHATGQPRYYELRTTNNALRTTYRLPWPLLYKQPSFVAPLTVLPQAYQPLTTNHAVTTNYVPRTTY